MNQISARIAIVHLWLWFWVAPAAVAQPGMPGLTQPQTLTEWRLMPWRQEMMHRSLKSVAYGNDTFVAVGPGLTILTSKDGKDWVNRSSEIGNITANINFAAETYSAYGDTITFAFTEPLPEPPRSLNPPSASEIETNFMTFKSFIESNGLVLSDYASKKSFTESNGLVPSDRGLKFPQIPLQLRSVAFGGGTFVIVGDYGEILVSHDGQHWAAPTSGTSVILTGVIWGHSGFVVIGDKGTILTSSDGSTWIKRNSGTEETLFGIAYGNGTFVAVGDGSTILTSSDGIEWHPVDIGPEAMDAAAFGNGVFVATSVTTDFPGKMDSDSKQTMVSSNGRNWRAASHPNPREGQPGAMTPYGREGGTTSLAFGGGVFVATTDEGIFTSRDGNRWDPSTEPGGFKSCYYGASFGNGIFVAVGDGWAVGSNHVRILWRTIATSRNGGPWELSQTPPSRLLWGHLIDEKTFFTVSFRAPIRLLSNDGETWAAPDKIPISGNVAGNQAVFYSGSRPVVLSSKDGIVWTRLRPVSTDRPVPVVVASGTQSAVKSENGALIDLNGQAYKLNLTAEIGQLMEVQASTNLQDWITLTTITNTGGVLHFVDSDMTNYPMRFYRLKLQ